jgi:hypothetical protein
VFSIEADRSKRLVVISVAQHVSADEARQAAQQVRQILESVPPGFRMLSDFRWLDSMDPSAAPHIADIMDALSQKEVASIVRVVPDPHKDIGLNILSQFHYDSKIPIATFETLADALQSLMETES